MAKREPPVELFYSPEDLNPHAPRLYVWRDGDEWRLEDEAGAVLSTHRTQSEAVDAALGRSKVCFSEILVRGSTGRIEWLANQDPKWLKLAREFDQAIASQRVGAD